MLTVETYRGIVSGWRTITVTNDAAKAERMLSLASRIFSAYPNRLRLFSTLTIAPKLMASTVETDARPILWDGNGVFIPQIFCDGFDADDAARINVDFKDVEICQAGPDHPNYQEAWQAILDDARITDATGRVWRLWQDGDLWEIPEDYEIPDFF